MSEKPINVKHISMMYKEPLTESDVAASSP